MSKKHKWSQSTPLKNPLVTVSIAGLCVSYFSVLMPVFSSIHVFKLPTNQLINRFLQLLNAHFTVPVAYG